MSPLFSTPGAIASWAFDGRRTCRSNTSSIPSSRRSHAAVQAPVRRRFRDDAILVDRPQTRAAVRRKGQCLRRVLHLRHRDEEAADPRQDIIRNHGARASRRAAGNQVSRARWQADYRLSHAAGRRRAAATCRWCCWCTAVRMRATTSRSTGGRPSSLRAAMRCCRPTTAAPPATATSGSTPDARDGATASCRPTSKTAPPRSRRTGSSTPSASASWAGHTADTRRSRAPR